MNKDRAAQIDRITREASQLLDDSVQPVRAACTEKATGVYRSAVGRAMGEMAAGLLFPVWREHPDLGPKGLGESGSYNAREFEMPQAVADQALATLIAITQPLGLLAAALLGSATSGRAGIILFWCVAGILGAIQWTGITAVGVLLWQHFHPDRSALDLR